MNTIAIHDAGTSALLLDAAHGAFDENVQSRIRACAAALAEHPEIVQAVPGVNNLLAVFDPLRASPDQVVRTLRHVWDTAVAQHVTPREIEIIVTYNGEDLADIAAHAACDVETVITLHTQGIYRVAAIGAMPGFVYLTGLAGQLCLPRRPSPRLIVPQGSVVIGGGHAGVMPCTAPSGWHILGHTDLAMFVPDRAEPCLFALGDLVRFRRAE